MITITNQALTVEVSPLGAELQSVVDGTGASWLWHGDPTFWAGRAPLLFPVIGRSFEGNVLIDGTSFPMDGHGFARTSRFALREQSSTHCILRLEDSEETQRRFPFRFALDMTFSLDGSSLYIEACVVNRDSRVLPFCFGFHPAFPWPLAGSATANHEVHLEPNVTPTLLRIDEQGLLKDDRYPSPFSDGVLRLDSSLFTQDAMIFDEPGIKSVWYGVPGKPGIRVEYDNLPQLGIWTKPGAPFLCIEPWHGLPAPSGRQEALESRRGVACLDPGETMRFPMKLAFAADQTRGL
ncbi:aldose 1-epimerase family protein [Microvirga rosea]|uniref:aldose 1-epimerase family protein n=1 Tax=Microvirga rosea TaxID=2715425 RepID=UPI001D0A6308|nr:aldose 1-epimerase family protein [Microvirga rosea]MCB8821085.1 aldose 1-epimerase family protein [Microvirga rosea]